MRNVILDGIETSAIGLGTWQFGSREWGYGDDYAERVAPALVRRALELGITFIDTAEIYGFGRSERIVAAGLAAAAGEDGRLPATPLLATKLFPVLPLPDLTVRSAEASRERLGVDAIDLYQLHWPNPLVPQRTIMRGFRRLLDRGVVRRVGVSNHSLGRWRAAERALGQPVVSDQVRFNLATPGPLWDLVPYAKAHGKVVIAYSPLGQGLLARHADDETPVGGVRRMGALARPSARALARPLLATIDEVARAHGASRAQVALAWVIAPGNVIAIPGARTVEQLEENAAAADLRLAEGELAALTREADRLEAGLRL